MSHELCHECGGEGSTGMYRDGSPIVCTRCKGDGCEPSRLPEIVDAHDDVGDPY